MMAWKVFIVDDESDLLDFYSIALTIKGYEVLSYARNGEEAVERYAALEIKPDIIIMDHRMPYKNGLEATKEILEMNPAAKIIFASADIGIEPEARALGIAAFKKKPFSLERLISNIEIICQQKEELAPAFSS